MAFFPSLNHNFIAYRSSKVSDCIFEIHKPWQSGFSRVYSNCCCSCSFKPEIIKIGRSSYKMYSNNILNFQESTLIFDACKKSLETYWMLHVLDKSLLKTQYYKVRMKVKVAQSRERSSSYCHQQQLLFSPMELYIWLLVWLVCALLLLLYER